MKLRQFSVDKGRFLWFSVTNQLISGYKVTGIAYYISGMLTVDTVMSFTYHLTQ